MNRKKIPEYIRYHFCNLKKIYYKNKFLIQDLKSISAIARRKSYKKELLSAVVIPTTFCNANCTFCANRYATSKRGIMSFEMFKKAVDEFKSLGIKKIDMTPMIGEPLIDKGLFKKIEYIYESRLDCFFYTNGFLIRDNLENLLKSPLKNLIIDIADVIPEYESKVFQVPEDQCKKKINAVLELIKRNKKIDIQLSFRPMREFSKVVKDMKKTKFWKYYKEGKFWMNYLTAYDNWGGSITKKDLIGFQTLGGAPKIKKFPCKNLSSISILPSGDIRVCGCRILNVFEDELVIGNLNKTTIKKALDSKKYDLLLNKFEKGNIPKVCEKCTFYIPKYEN